MRPGAVRARRDDRLEGGRLCSELVEELVQAPRELALRASGEALLGKTRVCLARQRRGPTNGLELSVVLDRPQLLDETAARHELNAAARERLPAAVGQVLGLEADSAFQQLAERRVEGPLRLDELHSLDRAAELRVTEVAEEPYLVGLDHERRVRALEADEVADVDEIRDEQRLFQARLEALDAGHAGCSARNSKASRYPSGPLPTMRHAATSAITEWRRQSSRSSMFERCTSTTGASNSSSASRIA